MAGDDDRSRAVTRGRGQASESRAPGPRQAVAVATATVRISSRLRGIGARGVESTRASKQSARGKKPPRPAPPTSSLPDASLAQSTQGISPNRSPAATTAQTADYQGPGKNARTPIDFPAFDTSAGPSGTLVTDPGTGTSEGPASGQDGAGGTRSMPAPEIDGEDDLFKDQDPRPSVFASPPPVVAPAQKASAFQPPPPPRRSPRVSPPSAAALASKRNARALAPRVLERRNMPASSSADAVEEDAAFVGAPAHVNVAPASGNADIDLSEEPLDALEVLNKTKMTAAQDRSTTVNLNICLTQALEKSAALEKEVKNLKARLLNEQLKACSRCNQRRSEASKRQALAGELAANQGARKKSKTAKGSIADMVSSEILRIDQEQEFGGDLIKVSRVIRDFLGWPGFCKRQGVRYQGQSRSDCFLTFMSFYFQPFLLHVVGVRCSIVKKVYVSLQ